MRIKADNRFRLRSLQRWTALFPKLLVLGFSFSLGWAAEAVLQFDMHSPRISFAAAENRKTVEEAGYSVLSQDSAAPLGQERFASYTAPPSIPPTPGGNLLEAEAALFSGAEIVTSVEGKTGNGYLRFEAPDTRPWVEWTIDAPRTGTFGLEIRYLLEKGEFNFEYKLNEEKAGAFILWTTGGPSSWAWDRINLHLEKGKNTFRLNGCAGLKLDHLNLLDWDAKPEN